LQATELWCLLRSGLPRERTSETSKLSQRVRWRVLLKLEPLNRVIDKLLLESSLLIANTANRAKLA
jgi:hypothetical protein